MLPSHVTSTPLPPDQVCPAPQQFPNSQQHPTSARPLPGLTRKSICLLGPPVLHVELDLLGPLEAGPCKAPAAVSSGWWAVWVWAELGEAGLEVLLEKLEAELLTVALEDLGQSWGATEEDMHLAFLLSGHLLEHLESAEWGKGRGRRGGLWTRPVTHPVGLRA